MTFAPIPITQERSPLAHREIMMNRFKASFPEVEAPARVSLGETVMTKSEGNGVSVLR